MAILIHIPGPLRPYTGGLSQVAMEATGGTLRDVLLDLWRQYPGLRDRLANEQGEVREHINLFLENENVRYLDGLGTRIPDGAEISIVPSISGG